MSNIAKIWRIDGTSCNKPGTSSLEDKQSLPTQSHLDQEGACALGGYEFHAKQLHHADCLVILCHSQ